MWLLCNFVTLIFSWLFLSPAKSSLLFNPWNFKFQWLYFSFSEIPLCTLLGLCGQFWGSLVPLVFVHFSMLSTFMFLNLIIPFSFVFTDPLSSLFAVVFDSRLKWLVSSFTITPKSLSSIRNAHCALGGGRLLSLSSGGFCVGQATPSACQVPVPLQSWGLVLSSPLIIHRLAFCHQSSMTLWPQLTFKKLF